MKTTIVSLTAILFAFFLGCQDSSITDPVSNDSAISPFTTESVPLDKDVISYYPSIIKLEGLIFDPIHRLNSYAKIKGVVRYRFDKIQFEKRSAYSGVKFSLYINAELKSDCPNSTQAWTVNERNHAIINISSFSPLVNYFEKSFRVYNTCCGSLNLLLKFRSVDNTLSVESMRLEKVKSLWTPVEDRITE